MLSFPREIRDEMPSFKSPSWKDVHPKAQDISTPLKEAPVQVQHTYIAHLVDFKPVKFSRPNLSRVCCPFGLDHAPPAVHDKPTGLGEVVLRAGRATKDYAEGNHADRHFFLLGAISTSIHKNQDRPSTSISRQEEPPIFVHRTKFYGSTSRASAKRSPHKSKCRAAPARWQSFRSHSESQTLLIFSHFPLITTTNNNIPPAPRTITLT